MFNTDFGRAGPGGATPPQDASTNPPSVTGDATVDVARQATGSPLAGLPSRAPATSSHSPAKGWKERLAGLFTAHSTRVPASQPQPQPALPVAGRKAERAQAGPLRSPDALQVHIDRVLATPKGRKAAADIGVLFGKLGDCRNAKPLAVPLSLTLHRLVEMEHMPRDMFIAFMPRLVETLIGRQIIDSEHATVARQAAERTAAYATIFTREGKGGPGAEKTLRAYTPFVARLLSTAVNPAWLQQKLEDPAQWPDLIHMFRNMGRMPESGYVKIQKELLEMCDDMEASAYVPPALCALLRERVPDILQSQRLLDMRNDGNDGASLAFRIAGRVN